ncbi:MAG TPA: hypothetical protein DCP69_00665 [Candidatus Omnitrophica bacterium]|nr:hypothetical protein [Candidatus Omnitrophota bacterium]
MNLIAIVLTPEQIADGWSVAVGEHIISLQRHDEDVYCFSASAFDSVYALRKALAKAIVDWESAHSQAEPELAAAMAEPTTEPCPNCDGEGRFKYSSQMYDCQLCHGTGRVLVHEPHDCPPVEPDDDTPAVQTGENF